MTRRRTAVVFAVLALAVCAFAIVHGTETREARSRAAVQEGESLLAAGDLDAAKAVLKSAFLRDRSNSEIESLLARVNAEIEARDARKAHQQHGHEGTGGVLAPEDVER